VSVRPSCPQARRNPKHSRSVAGLLAPAGEYADGLVEKTHLASAINTRLLHASNRIIHQLTELHGTGEDAREREEIPQDRRGGAAVMQSPLFPRFNPVGRKGAERVGEPAPEVPLELLQRVGRGARTVGSRPPCVRVPNELPEGHAMDAIETAPGVPTVSDIAQHLLASRSSLIGRELSDFAECDPMIGAEPNIIGAHAGGLHAQRESRK
jgi:hypothetical protein